MALKVFGGLKQVRDKQLRTIVAASSQKQAAELLNVSASAMKDYFPITGVPIELETALAAPGVVFQATSERGDHYSPLNKTR